MRSEKETEHGSPYPERSPGLLKAENIVYLHPGVVDAYAKNIENPAAALSAAYRRPRGGPSFSEHYGRIVSTDRLPEGIGLSMSMAGSRRPLGSTCCPPMPLGPEECGTIKVSSVCDKQDCPMSMQRQPCQQPSVSGFSVVFSRQTDAALRCSIRNEWCDANPRAASLCSVCVMLACSPSHGRLGADFKGNDTGVIIAYELARTADARFSRSTMAGLRQGGEIPCGGCLNMAVTFPLKQLGCRMAPIDRPLRTKYCTRQPLCPPLPLRGSIGRQWRPSFVRTAEAELSLVALARARLVSKSLLGPLGAVAAAPPPQPSSASGEGAPQRMWPATCCIPRHLLHSPCAYPDPSPRRERSARRTSRQD